MRIVTLNTWKGDGAYHARLGLMGEGLAALQADVICLQEVFHAPDLACDTAAWLEAATGMHASRAPSRAKPRSCEARTAASTSGLAILTRAEPAAMTITALPTDSADGERIALMAEVGELLIVCVHFTHLRGAAGARLRRAQAEAAMAAARAQHGGPIVIAGDFNAAAADPALDPIFRAVDHVPSPDESLLSRPSLLGPHPGEAPPAYPAIDHVALIDPTGAWTVARRLRALDHPGGKGHVFPSDHAAMVADLARR